MRFDWLLVLYFAGTGTPLPHARPEPMPDSYVCRLSEREVQLRNRGVDAVCVNVRRGEVYNYYPVRGKK